MVKGTGKWVVTFADGKQVITGYYTNARMAVGEALSKHKGKVVHVKFVHKTS